MVKHPACAAAISSSGLVPFSFSKRVLKEYGVAASTPESVEMSPLPARPVPRQTAFALRIMEVSYDVLSTPNCRAARGRPTGGRTEPQKGFAFARFPLSQSVFGTARSGQGRAVFARP